ncbi:MAG: hypothetical protein PUC12_14615 [Clostridiales bacterium]|nr:hypothetical protein [Clostridiales bacterium]
MEKLKSDISKIAYYCFYLGIVIEVAMVIIDKSAYTNPIEGRLFQITFLLFLLKVCMSRYAPREYLTIFLFCILGAVSYFITGRNEVIRLVIFIAACKDIDMKVCLKTVFYMTLVGCGLLIFLSLTGIYGDVSLTQEYGRGGVETRYTLGMGHPNALQCMVWALTVLGLYLYGKKMKWYHYGLIVIINFFFFLLTDSKTSFLVTLFTVMIAFVISLKKNKWIQKISIWICFGVTIVSIVISVVIAGNAYRLQRHAEGQDSSFVTMLLVRVNNVLNGRIRVLSGTTNYEGTIQTWSLFSKPENNYYFDMGWVRLFYWYGIIPACIFIAVMLIIMWYCYKNKHYMAVMMIASFALYTVIEAHGISVYLARNYVFFLIGAYWNYALCGGKENESIDHESHSIHFRNG